MERHVYCHKYLSPPGSSEPENAISGAPTIKSTNAIIGGFVQWFPLFTGLTINPKWLKAQFAVIFVGVNLN
jgi:hypothetical protein